MQRKRSPGKPGSNEALIGLVVGNCYFRLEGNLADALPFVRVEYQKRELARISCGAQLNPYLGINAYRIQTLLCQSK